MSVSIEKTSNLGRRLTIQVPADVVQAEEKIRLKDLAKNIRLDGGFRNNEAKANFVKKKYATQIRQDAVTQVLQKTLGNTLKQENLRPANQPSVEDLKDEGKDITYTVTFEVYPEIELKDFANIELEKEVADITAEDIESGVTKLQDQFATWQDVTDRAAQKGDQLIIDFVGKIDGVPFANGSATKQPLEIGSGRFIPGFEEALIGAKIGEEKTININFPADYNAKDLAGKAAEFDIKVHKIQAKVPVAVDEEFAAKIGIEDKDVTKVREKVRENMVKYVEDLGKSKLREQALEKLYEAHKFDLPAALIDHEKHNLIHERLNKAHDDHDHDLTPEQDVELTAEAKKRVSIGLILNEIVSKHKLKPEEARVLAKIRSLAMMYGAANAEFIQKMYYESKELRENVQNMALTDQAADLVVAGATIKEIKKPFYDIVK